MVFCNVNKFAKTLISDSVTILILIDGFLQWKNCQFKIWQNQRHNPYFNRWFSAIMESKIEIASFKGHNPYFNRWFSAIRSKKCCMLNKARHNPYFNRWFSAISWRIISLYIWQCHNPYFNRWFSAIRSRKNGGIHWRRSQSLF